MYDKTHWYVVKNQPPTNKNKWKKKVKKIVLDLHMTKTCIDWKEMTHSFLFVYLKYTICNYTLAYFPVCFIVCLSPWSPASLRTKAALFTTEHIL